MTDVVLYLISLVINLALGALILYYGHTVFLITERDNLDTRENKRVCTGFFIAGILAYFIGTAVFLLVIIVYLLRKFVKFIIEIAKQSKDIRDGNGNNSRSRNSERSHYR